MNRENRIKLDELHADYCARAESAELMEEKYAPNEPRNERMIRYLWRLSDDAWKKYENFRAYLIRKGLYG